MPNVDAPLPAPQKLPFFPKNKKFLIPIIILLTLTLIGLIAGLFIAFTALQRTEAFDATMVALEGTPEVEMLLGSPLEAGLYTMGKIDERSGVADLMFTVTGPNDSAAVRSRCELVEGKWVVVYLDMGLGSRDDGEVITLIGDPEMLPQ